MKVKLVEEYAHSQVATYELLTAKMTQQIEMKVEK